MAGPKCTTVVVVSIDDSQLFRFTLLTDLPFVRTDDDIVETPVGFVACSFRRDYVHV